MTPLDFSAMRRKDDQDESPLPEWVTRQYTEDEAAGLRLVVELWAANGRIEFYLHKYVSPEGAYFQYQMRR